MTIKQWFYNIIGSREKALQSLPQPQTQLFGISPITFGNTDHRDYLDSGFGNSTIYSIIQFMSDKIAGMPYYLYEVKDSQAYKRYKSLNRDINQTSFIEYERARKKALREVDNHPFLEVFDKLGFEGKAQLAGHYLLTGNCFLWKNKGGTGSEVLDYQILPGRGMSIKKGDGIYDVAGYSLQLGKVIEYDAEEIAHWKRWNPFIDAAGSHLYGLSPLRAGLIDLWTNNEGKRAAYHDFKNQGVRGALFRNEDQPWQTEQRDELKEYVDENMNGNENRGKILPLNVKAQWQNIGLSASEMEVMKALQLTKEDLCNIFQFPVRMLASVEGTFNNVETAGKQFITNCIYPRTLSYSDFVNDKLLVDFDKPGRLHYGVDITALPEMQGDMEKMYKMMQDAYWVSPEEKREVTNWDDSGVEEMKKFYFPSNLTPIEELGLGDNITNDVNNLNNNGVKDYDY